jgi:MFS family permease
VTAGARFIARSALVRASLVAAATLNFFYLMFAALYLLYAVRVLHIRPGLVGVLIGAGAIGAVLGALVTKRLAARIGAGWAYAAGCLLYTAPLMLWPLAHGAMPLVLAMLFAAEFVSGFGLTVLDITIGVIFAAIIDRRVPGGQLRHPAARRAAGQRCGTAARAMGGDTRRCGRVHAAAAHSPAALPATRGGRSGAFLTRCRRAGRPGSSSTRSPG